VKRILITGAAGFIGRHFTRYILENTDWSVVMLDRLGEGSRVDDVAEFLHSIPSSRGRASFVWHDLKAQVLKSPAWFPVNYIVHMAAGSHVDRSIKDPLGFVADNVTGTAHMLEFARWCDGLEKFLHFSTDEVFGAANGRPFDEYDSFHPTNPYAASKAAAEALCPAWANTYGLPIVVTRCTNVAGPGQDGEKFIPSTIAKVGRGEMVQIHARNGTPSSRKYIDVRDVCAATHVALTRGGVISGRGSGYYNIAGEVDHSNLDVAARIAELMGKELRWELVQDPPNRPRPDMRYDIDAGRLQMLGWKQEVPLDATLQRCIECV
jgi:dTDP-glucose 4,6-dehydratase